MKDKVFLIKDAASFLAVVLEFLAVEVDIETSSRFPSLWLTMLASTPVTCWLERQRRSAAGPTFFSMSLGMVTEVIQVKQVTSLVHSKLKQIQSRLHHSLSTGRQ